MTLTANDPSPSKTRAQRARELPLAPSAELRNRVPGEDGPPLIGHTLEFVRDARGLVRRMVAAHGLDFRIRLFGFPALVVGHPDQVREVLMDREKRFSSDLGWRHAIGELFARGLMLRDFEEHRVHRRIMQSAFRADALRAYLEMMNPIIERGLRRWDPGELRFYPAIKELTLDIAAEVFVGVELGPEADRINQAFVDAVAASVALIKYEVPFSSYRRGMNGRRRLERFFAERIGERRGSDERDMFSEFCRARSDSGERYSDQEIVDHMIFLLMAAHDTTTSAITSMIWALAQNQEWQERAREECRAAGTALQWDDKDSLPLVDQVFKEALRVFPPVPFIGRRLIEDARIGDHELPANSAIDVCSLVTHFSDEHWSEPQRFDPERFSPQRAEDRGHSHQYYPFGGGAHTCIGMHFAFLQVKAFMTQFLDAFRVRLHPGYELDMKPIPIPKPSDGLPVVLEAA